MAKPLQGIRVLDLTRVLSGPYCTMLLADMGAEVIKIESPRGDDSRAYPPFDKGISAYYANLNRNKKSIKLDLHDEKAKDVLRKLIKVSDVFVENFKPGTIAKMGFSYEEVKKLNPNIIFASISDSFFLSFIYEPKSFPLHSSSTEEKELLLISMVS